MTTIRCLYPAYSGPHWILKVCISLSSSHPPPLFSRNEIKPQEKLNATKWFNRYIIDFSNVTVNEGQLEGSKIRSRKWQYFSKSNAFWFCANWLIDVDVNAAKEKDGSQTHILSCCAFARTQIYHIFARICELFMNETQLPWFHSQFHLFFSSFNSTRFESIRCEICGLHFNVITSIHFQKPKVVDIFSRHTLKYRRRAHTLSQFKYTRVYR